MNHPSTAAASAAHAAAGPLGDGAAAAERCWGIGVSGYGHYFRHWPWSDEPSGAWAAITAGIAHGDLEGGCLIGHGAWARRPARTAIRRWMADDRSMGGSAVKNIMLVCVSWGAGNAVSLSAWFSQAYGFKPRLFVMIEGVARWGWPYPLAGTAATVRNYYIGAPHWPRGMAVPQADNVDLDRPAPLRTGSSWQRHIAGEWAGSACAIEDIHRAGQPAGPAAREVPPAAAPSW
jgi:hypothetical protein